MLKQQVNPESREPTLSFPNVGMSGGGPSPAWHLSASPDWGNVVLLGKGSGQVLGAEEEIWATPTSSGEGAQLEIL